MSWRGAAAIGVMLAAGCGGATASGHGSPVDSGAEKQAPDSSTGGRADRQDAAVDATSDAASDATSDAAPDATQSCGGAICAQDELCHWEYATCGRPAVTPGNGELWPGSCVPRDAACDAQRPVCGCDGKAYASDCAAHSAGVDTWWEGCAAPPGYFVCGAKFCQLDTEICREEFGDTGDRYSQCEPRPACDAGKLCDCLHASPNCDPYVTPTCSDDGQGRVTESCWYT